MDDVIRNKKSIIIEFILVNAFILNLAVGMISNYSTKIFLLKGVISAILILAVLIVFRNQKIEVSLITLGVGC